MTSIIILAAGSSSRMCKAKQNLDFKGLTLLQTAVKAAVSSKANSVAVVLGANADSIIDTIKYEPIQILINKDWETGMGTSISYGLSELLKLQPKLSSVMFMLTDQPFTDTKFIDLLINKTSSGKIIASSYNDTLGPPVLFDELFFDDLLKMNGNDGAKKIIQKHPAAVIEIPFPMGALDIDTPEDYARITKLS